MIDPDATFDPNTWVDVPYEYRLYVDDNAQRWVVVDEIDYLWAIRYRWKLNSWRGKLYARRSTSIYQRGVGRVSARSIYLHVEIMKRAQPTPPSPLHCIVDHRNSNTLICTRGNLRWATHSMNSRNVHGSYSHELLEGD